MEHKVLLAHVPGKTGRPTLSPGMDVSAGFAFIEGFSSGILSVVGISSGSGLWWAQFPRRAR